MSYLDSIADEIRAQVPSDKLPQGNTDPLFRLYAILALAKGADVTASDVHNAWTAWMQDENPAHESLRPFEQLDDDTQRQDLPYVEAIRRVAAASNDR